MELILSLAGIVVALLVGAISPGPSFVLVARTAISVSRLDGLCAAIGMGIGGVVFSILILLGLQAVFASAPWLYLALKLMGGSYLLYMGVRIWRSAEETMASPGAMAGMRGSVMKSLLRGLLTQLSNPKTVVVYGSIFVALLPHDLPPAAALALPLLVFLVEAGWYAIVALALSAEAPRAAYLNSKKRIDRVAGGLMGLLGLKLIASAHSES